MEKLTKRAKEFDFEGRHYKIKVFKNSKTDGNYEYIIRAYINDEPANGYSYHVEFTTNYDFQQKFGNDAVSHLIQQAETDVTNKIWGKYLKAIKQDEKN